LLFYASFTFITFIFLSTFLLRFSIAGERIKWMKCFTSCYLTFFFNRLLLTLCFSFSLFILFFYIYYEVKIATLRYPLSLSFARRFGRTYWNVNRIMMIMLIQSEWKSWKDAKKIAVTNLKGIITDFYLKMDPKSWNGIDWDTR
jgi:hypothetical protein